MDDFADFIKDYGFILSAIGAALAFGWSIVQFLLTHKRESRAKEFEVYHRLIKELVQPPSSEEGLYIDRQSAVVYELRFFPRYYLFSYRTLKSLNEKWKVTAKDMKGWDRLSEEIELTLSFLQKTTQTLPYKYFYRKSCQ